MFSYLVEDLEVIDLLYLKTRHGGEAELSVLLWVYLTVCICCNLFQVIAYLFHVRRKNLPSCQSAAAILALVLVSTISSGTPTIAHMSCWNFTIRKPISLQGVSISCAEMLWSLGSVKMFAVLAHNYACELSCEHASSQGRVQCIQPSIHSQTYRFAISQE